MATELVKCCSILDKEAEGEVVAQRALQDFSTTTSTLGHVTCNLKLALADAFIGQEKYMQAAALLEDILITECLSSFVFIVAGLCLNKAKRRLGHLDMDLFAADSALYGSLISVWRAAAELKIEFLEELSATVSFVQQNTATETEGFKDRVDRAVSILAADASIAKDWRISVFERQFAAFLSSSREITYQAHQPLKQSPELEAVDHQILEKVKSLSLVIASWGHQKDNTLRLMLLGLGPHGKLQSPMRESC